MTTTSEIILIVVAILVGLSNTALPGLSVLAAALIAWVLPAKQSTGALLLMLITGDVMAINLYRRNADFHTLRRLIPPVLAGVVLGGVFLRYASNGVARRFIGTILLVMIVLTLLGMRRQAQSAGQEPTAAPPRSASGSVRRSVYGCLAGFTTMVANAGGPVTNMYFMSSGFDVVRFLGTTAWFYFAVNLVKLPISIGIGIINTATLRTDLALVPVVVGSALVGFKLATAIRKTIFDPIVLGLTVIGAVWLLL